jgi:hypothetical protein
MEPLRLWMKECGIKSLFDILVCCDSSMDWLGWKSLSLLAPLVPLYNSLLFSLHGCAPWNKRHVDSRGWNGSIYTVNMGYHALLEASISFPCFGLWASIWNNDGLPKINFFCWLLAHRKVLTSEKLCKRGIVGPSCCALYLIKEESSQHLFVDYNYEKEVWSRVLGSLGHMFDWHNSYSDLFAQWWKRYRGSFKKKAQLKRIWEALPKYVC